MGRPRKDRSERRSHMVRFLVRPLEYIRIQQDAIRAGKSLPDYLRSKVLSPARDGQTPPRRGRTLDPAVFDQLRRIGVNLNQAVHKLHATGRPSPELGRAAETVEQFLLKEIDHGSKGRR